MLHIFTRSYSRVISGVSFSILCYSILKGIRSPRHKSYSASCSPNVQKNFTSFPKWKIVGFFFLVCWFQLLLLFHCFAAATSWEKVEPTSSGSYRFYSKSSDLEHFPVLHFTLYASRNTLNLQASNCWRK